MIVLGVGSQQIMDGVKTLKSEVNCSGSDNIMRKNLNQMISTPPGPSVPSTMTTGSMLQQTKNSVGSCYVIPYHRKKELDRLSQSRERLDSHSQTIDQGIRSEHCVDLGHA